MMMSEIRDKLGGKVIDMVAGMNKRTGSKQQNLWMLYINKWQALIFDESLGVSVITTVGDCSQCQLMHACESQTVNITPLDTFVAKPAMEFGGGECPNTPGGIS